MKLRHYIHSSNSHGEYQPLVATWMLRLLLTHDWAFKGFFDMKDGFKDSDIAEFLNMPEADEKKYQYLFLRLR